MKLLQTFYWWNIAWLSSNKWKRFKRKSWQSLQIEILFLGKLRREAAGGASAARVRSPWITKPDPPIHHFIRVVKKIKNNEMPESYQKKNKNPKKTLFPFTSLPVPSRFNKGRKTIAKKASTDWQLRRNTLVVCFQNND